MQAREQRVLVHGSRRSLHDACLGIALHQRHHVLQRRTLHDAVGIQHHHIAIPLAETAAEIGHVTAFLLGIHASFSVKKARHLAKFTTQPGPGALFFHPDPSLGGVAQNEKIAQRPHAAVPHGQARGPQARKHPHHILVTDGHDHSGLGVGRQVFCRWRQWQGPAISDQAPESDQCRPETKGDPAEQQPKDHHHDDLQPATAPWWQNLTHGLGCKDGGHQHRHRKHKPTTPRLAPPPSHLL